MTQKQAYAEGLHYTGISEIRWSKEPLTKRAAEIRKKYKCRAVIVNCGEWPGIYADEKYWELTRKEDAEQILSHIEERKARALEEYKKALAEIENDEINYKKVIEEVNEKYGL